ncbi:protein of unknown function DUF421 [Granulicella mallensis MP5ACTX8]|jgi:uncharacterized membrane protein YcaP (DUF421 family)|uniref:YetF C-terminal domain-containing protein n=1 Tax=Granulicella mallensis (strain ATCC BAA-1857 / DSM 23137 / MP5ACTX8) TaxID=682795 RepID=G8NY01_GRAMM|nr:YetF domain-containing protein [Granulicella mallensis]AEU35589.1 protein of unknown function DUF421 [Granulicella mallensis MP5ACTX8]
MNSMMHSMFHLPLPVMEKILRPVIVYLFLIGFLRLFGKRELAQLNPFDLVVLLSLSNTVQNAIIGDDNSVSGGIIGAFALLAINWLLMWLLYRSPKLNQQLEGSKTVLIQAGVVSEEAMKKETLTFEELISVLNKNGFNNPADVEECVLEPNGTFFVKGKTPTSETVHSRELLNAVERLTEEVMAMRAEMQARG